MFHLIYFARTSTLTFIDISKKNIFYKYVHRKLSILHKHTLLHFVLAQFQPKKTMSQSPCFDIGYWGSYRPFLSRKSKWSKIQNIYCNFSNFQYNNIPLGWMAFNRIIQRWFWPFIWYCLLTAAQVLCCWKSSLSISLLCSSLKKGNYRVIIFFQVLLKTSKNRVLFLC